jgi:hypothetical protein
MSWQQVDEGTNKVVEQWQTTVSDSVGRYYMCSVPFGLQIKLELADRALPAKAVRLRLPVLGLLRNDFRFE